MSFVRRPRENGCRIKQISRIGVDEPDEQIVHLVQNFLGSLSSSPNFTVLDRINKLVDETLPESIAVSLESLRFFEFVTCVISNCDSYPHFFVQVATFCKRWSITDGAQYLFNDDLVYEICAVISNIELDESTIAGCASLVRALANILILFTLPPEVVSKIAEDAFGWFSRFETLSLVTEANLAIVSALMFHYCDFIEPMMHVFVDPVIDALLAAMEANRISRVYEDLALAALTALSYLSKIPEVQSKLVHPAFLQNILPNFMACNSTEYKSVLLIVKLLGTSEVKSVRDSLFHLFNWEKFSEKICNSRFSDRGWLIVTDENGSNELKEGFCKVVREILTVETSGGEEEEEENERKEEIPQRILTLYEHNVIQDICSLAWNHEKRSESVSVRCSAVITIMAIFPDCEYMIKAHIMKMLDKHLHEFVDYMEAYPEIHEMLPKFYHRVVQCLMDASTVQRNYHMNNLWIGLENVCLDDLSDDTREAGESIFQIFTDLLDTVETNHSESSDDDSSRSFI